MARTFRATPGRRAFNGVVVWLHQLGLPTGRTVSLTTTGRRTGQARTTPVSPIEVDEARYLVAPYGPVDWVRNVRANPDVTIARGRHTEPLRAVEVPPDEAAPVIKAYLQREPIVRPYSDLSPQDDLEAFAAGVAAHPVFRLEQPAQPS